MAKRGNGQGAKPVKRKDGRWMARYTVQTPDGPKQKAVYGQTSKEASEKLTRALAEQYSGVIYDDQNMTMEEYLDLWLVHTVRDTVRYSTFNSYEGMVNNHLKPGLGRVKLSKLKPIDLKRIYRDKLDKGFATRTVQYMHTIAKKALKDAVRMELVPRNPVDAVDPPKLVQEEIVPMGADQVRALLAATKGGRLSAFYTIAVHTGMRPGEMLALRWDDVDLEGRSLRVKRALSGDGKIAQPKTPKSRRRIELSATSVEALRGHRKRQLEERVERAGLWEDHGLVFASETGTLMTRNKVRYIFRQYLQRSGLPETFRLYDLRHTCATLLLARNVHPKYVQELLGHASIRLTLDTYSHVIPGMNGGTALAIDEALG